MTYHYVQSANLSTRTGFTATYCNGEVSQSHDASCFFMIMQEKRIKPADLDSHIKLGKMMDPDHEWDEIQRIAATFQKPKPTRARRPNECGECGFRNCQCTKAA